MTTFDPLAERRRHGRQHAGTIRAYFPWWESQVRVGLLRVVAALPEADLDFKPRPELLTARETLVHIAEAERSWVHCVLDGAGGDQEWVVPVDERQPALGWRLAVDPPDRAGLIGLLEHWHRPTLAWLDRPESDLAHEVYSEGRKRHYTAHWVLDRVHEHEIHHREQLALYLRLLGHAAPGGGTGAVIGAGDPNTNRDFAGARHV
jgi:uncharacterized damage-inducible protein DinB